MPYTLKPNKIYAKDPNSNNYLPQNVITDQSTAEEVAAIEAKGAATLASIPDDYSTLSNEVDDLKSAFNNALGDAFVNIIDPDVTPVNLYPDGQKFAVANFIYSLPVKVKPNTYYTVMQKTPSLSFRCSVSSEYPAVNVASTIVGDNNNTSPKHFTTGATTQYLLVGYKNTQQSETYTPYDIMVAEGYHTEFIEYGAFELTDNMFGVEAKTVIATTTNSQKAASGSVIECNSVEGSKIQISSQTSGGFVASNSNLLTLEWYEKLPGESKTTNGITFTVNSDGTITANGTAIANADFYIRRASAPSVLIGTQYPIWLSFMDGYDSGIFAYSNGTSIADYGFGEVINSASSSAPNLTSIMIRIPSGVTVTNKKFSPMLSFGCVRKNFISPVLGQTLTSSTTGEFTSYGDTIVCGSVELNVIYFQSQEQVERESANKSIKTDALKPFISPGIISICHRGFLTEAPENSIYSFRLAAEADIDYLESDIQITSDGVPVMFHDPTIDRVVTGHTGTIADYTYVQVKEFDISTYFQDQYPSKWKAEYSNARIMSLEEYLAFACGVGKKSLLEIKSIPSNSASVLKAGIESIFTLISKYNYQNSIIWSGSPTTHIHLYRILSHFPNSVVAYNPDSQELTEDRIKFAYTFDSGTNAVLISSNMITSTAVESCKAKGIPLIVYMVDTLQEALALNPYIKLVMSNSQNIAKTLNNYYLGN